MLFNKTLIILTSLFFIALTLPAQQWQYSSPNAYYNGGNVGIGTSTPVSLLHVNGQITAGNAGGGYHLIINDVNTARWALGTGDHSLHFANDYTSVWTDRVVINPVGNVGIGTTNPWARLDIRTAGANASDQNALNLNNPSSDPYGTVTMVMGSAGESSAIIAQQRNNLGKGASLAFWTTDNTGTSQQRVTINDAGSVAIGTLDPKGYKLAVNGSAIFTKVKVQVYPWSDYVFDATYRLRSLAEVEKYIQQHHHLPEVPSAAEVEKEGLDVGDNQATLLRKIEELTLYVIEQDKKQLRLNQQVEKLQQENSQVKEQLKSLLDKKE